MEPAAVCDDLHKTSHDSARPDDAPERQSRGDIAAGQRDRRAPPSETGVSSSNESGMSDQRRAHLDASQGAKTAHPSGRPNPVVAHRTTGSHEANSPPRCLHPGERQKGHEESHVQARAAMMCASDATAHGDSNAKLGSDTPLTSPHSLPKQQRGKSSRSAADIAALRARFEGGHFRHAMRADLSCFAAGAAALRQEARKPANCALIKLSINIVLMTTSV